MKQQRKFSSRETTTKPTKQQTAARARMRKTQAPTTRKNGCVRFLSSSVGVPRQTTTENKTKKTKKFWRGWDGQMFSSQNKKRTVNSELSSAYVCCVVGSLGPREGSISSAGGGKKGEMDGEGGMECKNGRGGRGRGCFEGGRTGPSTGAAPPTHAAGPTLSLLSLPPSTGEQDLLRDEGRDRRGGRDGQGGPRVLAPAHAVSRDRQGPHTGRKQVVALLRALFFCVCVYRECG
jgi:hypothetical protein